MSNVPDAFESFLADKAVSSPVLPLIEDDLILIGSLQIEDNVLVIEGKLRRAYEEELAIGLHLLDVRRINRLHVQPFLEVLVEAGTRHCVLQVVYSHPFAPGRRGL
jgi:hypothetical protein